MSKKIYLVDGYGFVFRAYHSMPPLTNPDGIPVGAVYGFTNMLTKVLRDHQPDYMAVVFDAGAKTFRNDIYPEYKANRPPAPEDLVPQFPLVRDAAEALGLLTLDKVGFEADDIIATLVQKGKTEGLEVVIISSDKDLMQLVGDGVVMFDAMKSRMIAESQVQEKFGVLPNKVLDVLSLMGDSSDNVPGVPGIGPKTAAELINQYGSLDKLLELAHEIKQNKRRENLIEFADQARLSRELITLHYEVPIEMDFDKFKVNQNNQEGLLEFATKHNFKAIMGKAASTSGAVNETVPVETRKEIPSQPAKIFSKTEEIMEWLRLAKSQGKLAMYFLESGVGFAYPDGANCFIKFGEKNLSDGFDFDGDGGVSKDSLLESIKDILQEPEVLKIGYNIKEHIPHLLRDPLKETPEQVRGVRSLLEPFDDFGLMVYVSETGITNGELEYLQPDLPKLESIIGSGKSKKTLAELSGDELASFACPRAVLMASRHGEIKQKLFDDKLLTIYERMEKPLINVLAKMEKRGARLDLKELENLSQHFGDKIAELESQIHRLAGREFNIGSPVQLGEILFDEMGLSHGKKNKKSGNYSTGVQVLQDLAIQGHEIAEKVLDWRQLSKLKSTYTDSLQKQISQQGKVHTTYVMTAANTGRLSSQDPNLQNIPIRTEEGRKIRKAFIAEDGNVLISADYSQIELRLLAHVANIGPLVQAFKDGKDIHAVTAHQVFGVPLDAVDDEHRRKAKTINFGIIYGLSAHGLAERLKIPRTEAKQYIDLYFEQYPGIRQYMSDTIQFCKEHGYVQTVFGRKCYIKGINDKNGMVRQFSERAAINAPLQGSAADIIKMAMIELGKTDLPMTLQVHDELMFDIAKDQAEAAASKIKRIMENVTTLNVPLIVEANIGSNWGEVH